MAMVVQFMNSPKISIITPCLNSARYIEEAIQSVLMQDYDNFEHIIVDGGSTDGTIEILKKYPHLKWVSEPDDGQWDAMNKGFLMSDGDIIVYLNADDYFEKQAFSSVIPFFESGHSFVVGKVRAVNHMEELWINDPKITTQEMLRWWEPNAHPENPVGYFYIREVQEKIPFDNLNPYSMDLFFLVKASLQYQFQKIDVILGNFRFIEGTKTFQLLNDNKLMKDTMSVFEKYLVTMDNNYTKKYKKDLKMYFKSRKSGNPFFAKIKKIIKRDS